MIEQPLSAIWSAIAPAIGNHLWQSTLFAILAGVLAWTLRRNQARVRYWLWLAASMKFLVPFSLLISIGRRLAWSGASAGTNDGFYFVMEEISEPFTQSASPLAAPATVFSSLLHLLPALLTAAWLCGFVVVLIVWFARWRRVCAAMREAAPLQEGREVEALRRLEHVGGIRKRIEMLLSRASLEPGIFGIIRPVLVWPEGISARLEDAHLEAVLAHEVWHVRRNDNLAAAVHMVVEALFWFHPLVWWLGTRLLVERERACDEEVVESGSERQVYAESILKICEFCVGSPLACVSGVTGADLKKRIVNIMNKSVVRKLNFGKKVLLSVVGVAAIAAPVVFGLVRPTQGRAQSFAANSAPNASVFTRGYQNVSITSGETGNGVIQNRIIFTPDSLVAKNQTLHELIRLAYGVPANHISGGPDWLATARFNVEAKLDSSVVAELKKLSPEQQKAERDRMFQTLLADQFKVALHRESKLLPSYVLVIAKNGPKIHPAKPGDTYPNGIKGLDGQPAGPHKFDMSSNGMTVQAMPIAFAVDLLSRHLNQPVQDRTGLTGDYDFTFRLTTEGGMTDHKEVQGGKEVIVHPIEAGGLSPAFLAAIEEQLGLRLDLQTLPQTVLVIDRAEKPSAN
jgi:bla regulator protein BlaR1